MRNLTSGVLAAGVSIAALATGSAGAQTVTIQGVQQSGPHNLYVIDLPEDDRFGTIAIDLQPSGTAFAEAAVACATSGECSWPGAFWQDATNPGDLASNELAVIGALRIEASASAAGGSAIASAHMASAVHQLATGADADDLIRIEGILGVSADAAAVASTAGASALAVIGTGVLQEAQAIGGAARAQLTNDGQLSIHAQASADAERGALATAVAGGISQKVGGRTTAVTTATGTGPDVVRTRVKQPIGTAFANLENSSALDVAAVATAHGAAALAGVALVGIGQSAVGTDAAVDISNGGNMRFAGSALASGATAAQALAYVNGITQLATGDATTTIAETHPDGSKTVRVSAGPAGPASASLSNAGQLEIGADVAAIAVGGDSGSSAGSAAAGAFATGVGQTVIGKGAHASVDNQGMMAVGAAASARAPTSASAVAAAAGLKQTATAIVADITGTISAGGITTGYAASAHPIGNASLSLSNSGTFAVVADAGAEGSAAFAAATATGVVQFAAGTRADAAIHNDGEFEVSVHAAATGAFVTAAAMGRGITQAAFGSTLGDAKFENDDSVTIGGLAHAAGSAAAFASAAGFGVIQNAFADDHAHATLQNSGELSIAVTAEAAAASALAVAIGFAAGQTAIGSETASASLLNSGNFDFSVHGNAEGGSAALVFGGGRSVLLQHAIATGVPGDASVKLDNDGTFGIAEEGRAVATGTAIAFAGAVSGSVIGSPEGVIAISQVAVGGVAGQASAALSNSGSLSVSADANASAGGHAGALAEIRAGIIQYASAGGAAVASLANDGTISIGGSAEAVAQLVVGPPPPLTPGLGILAATLTIPGSTPTGMPAGVASASAIVSGLFQGAAARTVVTGTSVLPSGETAYIITRTPTGPASALLTNSGTVDISAAATARGDTAANAVAALNPGGQALFGLAAQATVENGGTIALHADATATGGGEARAISLNSGFVQAATASTIITTTLFTISPFAGASDLPVGTFTAYPAGTARASLTNSGVFEIGADAVATGGAGAVATAAIGGGYWQVVSGADAYNQMTNTNALGLDAHASAVANSGSASALALFTNDALAQVAVASSLDGTASDLLVNHGLISIAVGANAIADAGDAHATALLAGTSVATQGAIVQFAEGNVAKALVDNSATISIAANAHAFASDIELPATPSIIGGTEPAGTASALAHVGYAVSQSVHGKESASARISNSGAIAIDAGASATGNAVAFASAGVVSGVYQLATATSAQGVATATFANNGLLSVRANAVAGGGDVATAAASVVDGLYQQARGGASGTVSLDNTATIAVAASAEAAAAESANAFASILFGVTQGATATGTDAGKAGIALDNLGNLSVVAAAHAATTAALGSASIANAVAAVSVGVHQLAFANASASASIDNQGNIDVAAVATADASSALALATINTVILQDVGADEFAHAQLTNSGSLSGTAHASAVGDAFASALAVVNTGIDQSAETFGSDGTASAALANLGAMTFGAVADALAPDGNATASALLGIGIGQAAHAQHSAVANIGNQDELQLLAAASARAADNAVAVAHVSNGIFQTATASSVEGQVSAQISNGGVLTIDVDAIAAGGDVAAALAVIDQGVVQLALGGVSGTALASLTNSGSITIGADASAAAGSLAVALALDSVGIGQAVTAGSGASAAIDNSGTISIVAEANAIAYNAAKIGADATASALVSGVYQAAIARTTLVETSVGKSDSAITHSADRPSGPAAAMLTNSGTVSILASAEAKADDSAHALASLLGVQQLVSGSEALASISNEGNISVAGHAAATAGTYAGGSVFNRGILQTATATATAATLTEPPNGGHSAHIVVDSTGPAHASLTNLGSIIISATAHAVGSGGTAGDPATPGAGTGTAAVAGAYIIQGIGQLAAGSSALAEVANGGTITALASGVATGVDTGVAQVISLGIRQNANATAFSSSVAIGPSGSSLGSTYTKLPGGKASTLFENSGVLNVTAIAEGVGAGYARVDATATGVWQVARGGTAAVSVNNSGQLDVAAAGSVAGSGATAFVRAGGIIQQGPAGTAQASANVDNGGAMHVAASAVAHGTVTGAATAIAMGASQQGISGGGLAFSFDNSGSLDVAAAASASGGAYGGAGALAIGIQQLGRGETSALAEVVNSGTIAVDASAKGVASGFATATVVVLAVNQAANATRTEMSGGTTPSGDLVFALDRVTGGPASVSLQNSGSIDLTGAVDAMSTGASVSALATAHVVEQLAAGSSAIALLDNDGSIGADLSARGSGPHGAYAGAVMRDAAFVQFASAYESGLKLTLPPIGGVISEHYEAPVGPARAEMTNSGVIALSAVAEVDGGTGSGAYGIAFASAEGASQLAFGTSAEAIFDNSGNLAISASAAASAGTFALASAQVEAVFQGASSKGWRFKFVAPATGTPVFTSALTFEGPAALAISNSGTIDLNAAAVAHATGNAGAAADIYAFSQQAVGTDASAMFDNSGDVHLHAQAFGSGSSAGAGADALLGGQRAGGDLRSAATFQNSGTIDIQAGANAVATGPGKGRFPGAGASATAFGFGQQLGEGWATDIDFLIGNSGSMALAASAKATGTALAHASASARGFIESAPGQERVLHASLINSGGLSVEAEAQGATTMGTGTATVSANAAGYRLHASNADLSIGNSGSLDVSAVAKADAEIGYAKAVATGLSFDATGFTTYTGEQFARFGGDLSGTINNDGHLVVFASAAGVTGLAPAPVTQTGTSTAPTPRAVESITVGGGSASAIGITLKSSSNSVTVTNSGRIDVTAVTNGGPAKAIGILAGGNGNEVTPPPPPPTPRAVSAAAAEPSTAVLTINNSGDIIVRVSTDGGTTFHRGVAIDVTEAPNPAAINLLGGTVIGDVDFQNDADSIRVTGGETLFNGVINSFCMPAGGQAALVPDSAELSGCGVGNLTIAGGGNLHLGIDSVDGPSYVFMNTLALEADGTLTFDLPPATGGDADAGTYPQLFVDSATLDGTVVANVASVDGRYETTTYQNVIDANAMSIGPDFICVMGGLQSNSLLLNLDCEDDANNNLDVTLTRAAFNSIAGLNGNGAAVGAGLQCIYEAPLTGEVANMFSDLFLFTDAGKYNVALNQLSGSVYANYLNSFPSLGVHQNDLVANATNCEVPAPRGSVLDCRGLSRINVWGQLNYQMRKAAGDAEAGESRSDRIVGLIGVDVAAAPSLIVGADAGYLSNHFRDRQFGDMADGNGWTVGAYAVFDPGAFFVKGVTTYSALNGESTRHISFSGLAAGASFVATPTGSPDARMWTFGVHGGARFPIGSRSMITPYLNFDHVGANLSAFAEDEGHGAGLTIEKSTSDQNFATGGLKWATQLSRVAAEMNLGYRHQFGTSQSRISAYFNGDTDCDFNVVSASQKQGTFLAGISIGGKIGPADIRIGYDGEFNDGITSHSGNFKVVVPLGAPAARRR